MNSAPILQEPVTPNPSRVYHVIKRAIDIAASLFGLIVLSPLLLITALLIYIDDPGPVIFAQARSGLHNRTFTMYKFRSMVKNAAQLHADMQPYNEVDGPVFKIKDDPRITKVGRFIRKYSIDELPQLVNIIKGEMSIIGPRPPLVREVKEYTPYQMHRLDVKTGLSCYRECYGRSNIHNFDEWVESDLKYIRERSMWTDIKVILLTIKVVIKCEGAM